MSAKADIRKFVLLFAVVLIIVTIVAYAEPVPVPKNIITKKDAIKFLKKQIKKTVYEPAKKQVMPIIKAMANTFTQGIQNATETAILKGRDAYLHMKQTNQETKETDKKEEGEKEEEEEEKEDEYSTGSTDMYD